MSAGVSGRAHRLAAVIPVIDEEAAIGGVVRETLDAGACCVFVVDGRSRDGTVAAAEAAGAQVIVEPRRGYGRACLTGSERAAAEHDLVGFLDGDGSCDPADLAALSAALDGGGGADVALGARHTEAIEHDALPWIARLGNALVLAVLRLRTGRRVRDLSPIKVLRSSVLVTLDLDDPGFGWTVQLVARAVGTPGVRTVERPVTFRRRVGGRSKVSGSLRASIAAGRQMIGRVIAETRRRPAIVLVAKAPRAGHVKTRLAASIGDDAAVAFWSACLADLGTAVRRAARGRAHIVAIVPTAGEVAPVARLLGPGWSVVPQAGRGLGGAIGDAFHIAALAGSPSAIVVGGDNPTLPPVLLFDALGRLQKAPAVIGPVPDGGYYLVGVRIDRSRLRPWAAGATAGGRAPIRELRRAFEELPLGDGSALHATRAALEGIGVGTALGEPWRDVDTLPDLVDLVRGDGRLDRSPHLRAWLAAHAHLVPGPDATDGEMVEAPSREPLGAPA